MLPQRPRPVPLTWLYGTSLIRHSKGDRSFSEWWVSRGKRAFAKKRNQPQYTIASTRLKGSLDSHPRAIEFDTRHLIRISLWRGFYYDNVFSSSHALVFEGPAQLLHPLLRMGDDLRMKKWSLINVGSWSEGAKSLTPEKISTLHLTWGRLLPLLVFFASDIFFF